MIDDLFMANIFHTNDVCNLFIFSQNNTFKVSLLMGFDYGYFLEKEKFRKVKRNYVFKNKSIC